MKGDQTILFAQFGEGVRGSELPLEQIFGEGRGGLRIERRKRFDAAVHSRNDAHSWRAELKQSTQRGRGHVRHVHGQHQDERS